LQFIAKAASIANSITFLFTVGRLPGIPKHTGHTFVFGKAPNFAEHEQKILVLVFN
jgi:hypothetical protein